MRMAAEPPMKYRVFVVIRLALWMDYTDPAGKKFRKWEATAQKRTGYCSRTYSLRSTLTAAAHKNTNKITPSQIRLSARDGVSRKIPWMRLTTVSLGIAWGTIAWR